MKNFHFLEYGFLGAAILCGLVTLAILLFLAILGVPVLIDGHVGDILSSPWLPDQGHFGIQSMIVGSLTISCLALFFAFPLSLGCSAFIVCTGPHRLAKNLKRIVRLMAAVPTVVYGFAGIFLLVPLVRGIFNGSGMSILTAALLLAVLISPTMIFFFIDAFNRVPRDYLTAATALGGNRVHLLVHVLLPCAWPGIVSGLLLGLGRAVGDTMISLMVAGNSVGMPNALLSSARTLTAHIGLVIAADFDSLEFKVLFICGLILYLFTASLVVMIRLVVSRIKQ